MNFRIEFARFWNMPIANFLRLSPDAGRHVSMGQFPLDIPKIDKRNPAIK
jgi:hypothetical protein